ncbi:unnamed protein product [Diatraea saccharalis]|uniref:Uncharacterized protein n=1 Tax=Diatraea saccharalis TaxID=40085 RepID=A0A9N9WDA0_9NEOP|nr:unnamed protein product [Diatraea saccharalis]
MQKLRNETKSEILRAALDDVTCIPMASNNSDRTSNDVTDYEIKEQKGIFEMVTSGYLLQQDNNDKEFYEETSQSFKPEPTVQPLVREQIPLTDIALDSLPCPSELSHNKEDSLMLSSKDENYWRNNSSITIISNLVLVLTMVLINVLK